MSQIYYMVFVLVALGLLGFGLSLSIKKHNAGRASVKKKKGRRKYMPEFKKPGK